MNRKLLIPILVVAALIGLAVYSSGMLHRDGSLHGSGTVEARNIRVGSKIGGRIDKVLVREGDPVEAGQVLITFDEKELAASLAQSRAAAEKSQRGYRPEEIAAAEGCFPQTQATLEKLENGNRVEDISAGKAALAYDEARFRERQVLAPAAASIEVLDVRPGDLISPNTPVATLLERDQIYVRIYIPETQIGRLHLGQKAQIRVASFSIQVFDVAVEQINH